MPVSHRPRVLSEADYARLQRRKNTLEALRKQTKAAENRLRWDIFNTWRTGGGTLQSISEASGYSVNWVWKLIERIRHNDKFLRMALDEYMKEHPDATIE